MKRVSTDMASNDLSFYLRRQESNLSNMQTKMGTQQRIKDLSDDPIAASHAVRYDSVLTRMNKWEQNAQYAEQNYRIAEDYLKQATDIMQRVRELAVQGANGVYTPEDQKAMAVEVDQYLRQLVEISNARGSDGMSLFSGDKTQSLPYRPLEGNVAGGDGPMITNVDYVGNINSNMIEVGANSKVPTNFPGNQVFWSEKQQVFSSVDATGYQVNKKGSFMIDGQTIELNPGDNVYSIIAKINDSGAPVKAYLDPVKRSLTLETTNAHQIWLENGPGSSALTDLGILRDSSSSAPSNYAPTARISGGSLFDTVIQARDALLSGDVATIGGAALGSIDLSITSLTTRSAELGARTNRLQSQQQLYNSMIPDVTAQLSSEIDLDYTQAAVELKKMEYAQQASLSVAGKILPKTLLDFLG